MVDVAREEIDRLRASVRAAPADANAVRDEIDRLPDRIVERLAARSASAYPAVINATGVILHTNLGRAPLQQPAPESLASYLALEYDLGEGRRGQRLEPIQARLAEVVGAEAAVMVNNNAAAVLLTLAAHAGGREVVVSRGQLIEIGGSFRLPDVMEASGAHLVEVGCTNRTHLDDYAAAVGESTAAILVAHPSNYRIVGFSVQPALRDVAELCRRHGIPLLMDQGSGALHDLGRWGLPPEPTVSELLEQGADVVCCSGDKLLGGPQAGLITGGSRWVAPLQRHPLLRALRPDKTALAWMDRVLDAHRRGALDEIPVYRLLGTPTATLKRRARRLARRLQSNGVPAQAVATEAALGGGTTPDATVPSWGLALPGDARLARELRESSPHVVARLSDDRLLVDLRTVFRDQLGPLEAALQRTYHGIHDSQDVGA